MCSQTQYDYSMSSMLYALQDRHFILYIPLNFPKFLVIYYSWFIMILVTITNLGPSHFPQKYYSYFISSCLKGEIDDRLKKAIT